MGLLGNSRCRSRSQGAAAELRIAFTADTGDGPVGAGVPYPPLPPHASVKSISAETITERVTFISAVNSKAGAAEDASEIAREQRDSLVRYVPRKSVTRFVRWSHLIARRATIPGRYNSCNAKRPSLEPIKYVDQLGLN